MKIAYSTTHVKVRQYQLGANQVHHHGAKVLPKPRRAGPPFTHATFAKSLGPVKTYPATSHLRHSCPPRVQLRPRGVRL